MNLMQRMFGAGNGTAGSTASLALGPTPFDERRANIIKWWTYYHGSDPASGKNQWDYLYSRFEAMPQRELEDVENHTRICADRLRRLLVNSWRGFEFEDEAVGSQVREVFSRNRWPHLLNLAALTGKVTGDAFIKLAPAAPESRFGPVRIILLDSEAQGLYGESFRELALKTAAMLGLSPSGVKAVWNSDVILGDVEPLAREYEIGARSIRSVMRKIGIDDTEAMMKEIREEKRMKDEG